MWAWVVVASVLIACACVSFLISEMSSLRNNVGAACALIAAIVSLGTAGFALGAATRTMPPASAGRDNPAGASQFSGRLLAVQEQERKNLSRELHDGIGQVLTALKMELARLKTVDPADAERLDRARGLTDEMLGMVRNISRLLRPTALDDLGLEAALSWHVDEFTRRSTIPCELVCSLPDDEFLSEPLKTCVYRVVQEALNNCEKHATPHKVTVSVEQDRDALRVRVADDGAGFLYPVPELRGLGLIGMWERAAMLGGTVEIQSTPGNGTAVMLNLPMSRRTAAHASFDKEERG